MANAPYYRKRDGESIGLFREVKRLVVTTAVVAGIAYLGARYDFDQLAERYISGEKPVAEGFAQVSLQRKNNTEGKLEFYLVYGPDSVELPVLSGLKGPQAGSIDYVLQNIDYSRLSSAQSLQYLDSVSSGLDSSQKAEHARKVWGWLEQKQRYELVKAELDRILSR